jgi:hypothetical protein
MCMGDKLLAGNAEPKLNYVHLLSGFVARLPNVTHSKLALQGEPRGRKLYL